MRKKSYLIILFTAILTFVMTSFSTAKIGLELRGSYALINPTVLNSVYQNALLLAYGTGTIYNKSSFDEYQGSALTDMGGGGGSFQYFATDNFALFLKVDYAFLENDDIYGTATVDVIDSHIAFNLLYMGVGGRYYFNSTGFMPYASFDLGYFMFMNGFWELFTEEDQVLFNAQPGNIDYKDGFLGANIELGFQYMFTDTVGLGLGLGYRLASASTAAVVGTGSLENVSPLVTELNFSGVYFTGGLNFVFGGGSSGAAGGTAAKGTGAGAKYEAYGDYYFKAKNYKGALKYYGGAVKLDKGNSVLYKKIGLCYYYMKDMAKAKQYLGYYLKMNPNDTQIKKWLGM